MNSTVPFKETYLWSELKPRICKYYELLYAKLERDQQWHFGAMSDACSFRKLWKTIDGRYELDFYVSEGTPLEWRYATTEEREAHGWKH